MDSAQAPEKRTKGTIKSINKMMMVLDSFSRGQHSMTLAELADRTGLPKTTAHRIVSSLRDIGLLDQDGQRDSYRLGIKLFQLGSLVLASMDLNRHARPHVTHLQRLTGETVHLCVFDGSQMVFIERQEMGTAPITTVTTIEGAPSYCTGVGKAFLAFQREDLITRIIGEGLHRQTPNTITDHRLLRDELDRIRAAGYAVDREENEPNVRCVAAPIRDSGGTVFASISVSGPVERMPEERLTGLAPTVVETADRISVELGWRS